MKNIFRKIGFLIFFGVIITNAQRLTPLQSKTIEKSEAGHTFKLQFSKRPFKPGLHDLSKYKVNIIDGKEVFGIDGSVPREEFSEFSFWLDSVRIPVHEEIYKIFYDPDFGYLEGGKYIDAFWGNNYESVFVYMNGSDGAGGYSVTWLLQKNGQHTYSLIPTYEMFFKFNDSKRE
jgi:hypothetical protein